MAKRAMTSSHASRVKSRCPPGAGPPPPAVLFMGHDTTDHPPLHILCFLSLQI